MCIKGKSHWILCLVMLNCLKPKQFQLSIHEFLICGSAYSVSQAGVCWEGRCHAEAVALWFSQLVFGWRGLHPWRCPVPGRLPAQPRPAAPNSGRAPGAQQRLWHLLVAAGECTATGAGSAANGVTAAPRRTPLLHRPSITDTPSLQKAATALLSWSPRSCG